MKNSRFRLFAPTSLPALTFRRRAAIVSTAAALVALHSPSHAAVTWVGDTSPDWNTATNWSLAAPVLAGDSFTFGVAGTAGTTLNNDITGQVVSTGALIFSAAAPAYTLNGNTVTTTASTTTLTNSSAALQTINFPLNLAASLTLAGGADVTLAGAIGQAGTFGSRSLTNNLTAGNLTLGGIISMSDGIARTWTFAGSGPSITRVTGGLQDGGSVSPLIISPSNTAASVVLSGANTYTGTTTVNAGKLSLDFSAAAVSSDLINSAPALTLAGGTFSITGKSGATNTQSIAANTSFSTNKSSAIRVVQNGATSVTLTLAGVVRSSGSSLEFTLPTTGAITTTTATGVGTNKVLAASSIAYATVDGTTWATNTLVSAVQTIGALSAYQTDLFAAALDSDITANDAPAAFTVNTLRFNTASKVLTLNSSGTSTVTSGGILVTAAGAGSSIVSGGGAAGLTGVSAKEVVLINHATGAGFTISAPILDIGGTLLTIAGNGTTTLSGVNTYAGRTTLTGGGTIILGNKNAFGSGAGTVLWVSGGGATIGSGASTTLQAGIDLSGANKLPNAVTLSGTGIASGTNNLELGGAFTGNSGGSRTLTNNITGGGKLTLSGPVYLSDSASAGRTLSVAGSGDTFISGVISNFNGIGGAVNLTVNATGSLTLTNANTYTGITTLTLGKLNVNHANALATGTLVINGGTLDNTTNALVTNLGNNPVTWSGTPPAGFVFGTASSTALNNLDLGTGAVDGTSSRSMSFAGTGTTLTMGPLNSTSTTASRTFTFDGAGNTMSLRGFTIVGAPTGGAVATTAILAGSANLTITGAVVDGNTAGNGLTINRSGLTTLSGSNTYSGITAVDAGTLLVTNTNTGTGAVSVAAIGSLGGSGSLAAAVTAAGTIAPGNAGTGTLTTGAATLTGTLAVEINGATGDKLVSTGALDLTGATLTVAPIGAGFTLGSYVIAQGTSLSGTFASVPSGYTVTYSATQATLALGSVSPYIAWATTSHGLSVGNSGSNLDPDNDGIKNGIEFVIGGQPNPANANANSSALAPTSVLNPTDLVFTYRRTDLSQTQPGLVTTVEYGSNLTGWTTTVHGTAGVVITVTNDGFAAGVDKVDVSIPRALAIGAELFAHLKVVQ